MRKKIVLILADGFEEMEAVVPTDILRRAEFDVQLVGLTGKTVTSSHGVVITADKLFNEMNSVPDVLLLPGGMPGAETLGKSTEVRHLAEKVFAASEGLLTAICAAPAYTYAAWGLLAGCEATCYPGCESLFPQNVVYTKKPVVVSGKFITAEGPGAAAGFGFAIVNALAGEQTAKKIREKMGIQPVAVP